jgi:glycerate 2-kinase
MRVLICPDKFAGTLSAPEAARAVASGWRSVRPEDELVLRPLADGGPGFVDVLAAAHPDGKRLHMPTRDPLRRPVRGEILVVGDTAYVETAQATGLHHLAAGERDPSATSSAGLLPLLLAALHQGVRRVVLGLGGSATNDAGDAVLAGLPRSMLDGVELIGATDVDNPLVGPRGASRVFGPQKGADSAMVDEMEEAMVRRAEAFGPTIAEAPGAGAAGGLGAMILALGGRLTSGIDLVRSAIGLDEELARADLVITGEGSFDEQSLHGKVIDGIAGAARERGVRCVVLAGQITVTPQQWESVGVTDALSLAQAYGLERALGEAGPGLTDLSAELARRVSS